MNIPKFAKTTETNFQGVILDDFGLYKNKSITLQNAKVGDTLSIIVENHARQTYLTKIDPKVSDLFTGLKRDKIKTYLGSFREKHCHF